MLTGGSCAALNILENGRVTYTESPMPDGRYPVATMATFTCNHGYILDGSHSRTCQPSLEWSQQTPICNQGSEENNLTIYITEDIQNIFNIHETAGKV